MMQSKLQLCAHGLTIPIHYCAEICYHLPGKKQNKTFLCASELLSCFYCCIIEMCVPFHIMQPPCIMDWVGSKWIGMDCTTLDWIILDWSGVGWAGLIGLDWTGLDCWVRLD